MIATIIEMLTARGEHLFDRLNGPLNFRLIVMPLVVSVLAIRAHLKDVRAGKSGLSWPFVRNPIERRRQFRVGLRDFGKVFVVACVLDTIYQLCVLRAFYPGELLLVAVVSALVPYFLVRGPVARIAGLLNPRWAGPANARIVVRGKIVTGRDSDRSGS